MGEAVLVEASPPPLLGCMSIVERGETPIVTDLLKKAFEGVDGDLMDENEGVKDVVLLCWLWKRRGLRWWVLRWWVL